jgi:hypothetical protein
MVVHMAVHGAQYRHHSAVLHSPALGKRRGDGKACFLVVQQAQRHEHNPNRLPVADMQGRQPGTPLLMHNRSLDGFKRLTLKKRETRREGAALGYRLQT